VLLAASRHAPMTNFRQAAALVALVFQNASVALLTRKSRMDRPAQQLYVPATAVVLAEGIKFVACLVCDVRQRRQDAIDKKDGRSSDKLGKHVSAALKGAFQREELVLLAVPSLLYVAQNNALVGFPHYLGGCYNNQLLTLELLPL
jgi:UDP-sugar transporter A1/2/3